MQGLGLGDDGVGSPYDKQAYRGALLVRGCTALYFYRDGFVFQAHRLVYHST